MLPWTPLKAKRATLRRMPGIGHRSKRLGAERRILGETRSQKASCLTIGLRDYLRSRSSALPARYQPMPQMTDDRRPVGSARRLTPIAGLLKV